VTLELRDVNIKIAFEALSRATGVNFILDKDIKPDTKATIFVKKAPIEDAIEMVISSNGLQKKVLSENTVLVFPSNPQKLKDYQDLMIRSFYLSNTTAKQVAALVKSMLKTKDIFVDDRLNMMTMRDTPEVIRIAEKLVAANDLADPEVMLDIQVFEVNRSRLQELGVDYPNRIGVNSLIPITTVTAATGVVASSTVNSSSQLTLEGLLNLNKSRFDVSPNPAVNFRKTSGDVNVLSNPRIRVRNNEKAKILVGDKVPVITTTSTANVGISESVQYVDVGLTLNVEPRITPDSYVNIKVSLEVSSLGEKTVTRNGATVYTIGTRNANTILRLKDGETQVLAGLISDDERKNTSKLPGLGDIPLIGRLFSNQQDQKSKTEIVLAITPRIVSNIARPSAEISEYWSGTDAVISDKPVINIPATSNAPMTPVPATSNAPMTPAERVRERIRLRNETDNSTEEPAIEQQPEAPPTVNPESTVVAPS
jgi:general secretion pathway protein D